MLSSRNFFIFFQIFMIFFSDVSNLSNLFFLLLENFTDSDRTPPYLDSYISPIISKLWKFWKKSSPIRMSLSTNNLVELRTRATVSTELHTRGAGGREGEGKHYPDRFGGEVVSREGRPAYEAKRTSLCCSFFSSTGPRSSNPTGNKKYVHQRGCFCFFCQKQRKTNVGFRSGQIEKNRSRKTTAVGFRFTEP